MYRRLLLWLLLGTSMTTATTSTPSLTKPFVMIDSSGQFVFNDSAFNIIGTNAFWLSSLNTEDDIDITLGNMSAQGIKVVRTWAFNDVDTIPANGTWFQLIANGATTVNLGANGLQKLDTVIRLAAKHGLFVLLTLTNNWNPRPLIDEAANGVTVSRRDVTPDTNNTLPRNTLSNDYGGMDAYVREFGETKTHDEFYINPTIVQRFLNYTQQIVSRYVNNSAIFGWEIANDPRCNSTLPASSGCGTMTITQFHSVISEHISTIDPNHLITSGNQGFYCAQCPKLYPRQFSQNESSSVSASDQGVGPAYDGSLGVDSEDILNIPKIAFGTFQLFPDQYSYGMDDTFIPAFRNVLNTGLDWINAHAVTGNIFGKPMVLNGFGLVTQNNAPFFVPFNETQAPLMTNQLVNQTLPFVDDDERDEAYSQWIEGIYCITCFVGHRCAWHNSSFTLFLQ